MPADTKNRDHFENLFTEGKNAVDRGEFPLALELYEAALAWAKENGNADDIDRASCSRYAVLLRTNEGEDVAVGALRMILMRSGNAGNQFLAAYHVSLYYGWKEDFDKSRFYADLALGHAKESDSEYFKACGYSHLGNLLIRHSSFSEAFENYQEAWKFFDDSEVYNRLAILTSMSFCHLARGRFAEGFEGLFTVRRRYRKLRLGSSIATGRLRLAFCFGYLECGKYHLSILHGQEAMRIGEDCGDRDVVKKSLYLLGEAEKYRGDDIAAFSYFTRMQEEFYPENPFIPELLLGTDTKQLVNVWA